MKITRASYIDDGVAVPGILVKRLFRRPVFYSADSRCGWDSQKITKEEEKNLVVSVSEPGAGRSRHVDTMSDMVKIPMTLDYLTSKCANCPYWEPGTEKPHIGCTYHNIMQCPHFAAKYAKWIESGGSAWPKEDADANKEDN